MAEEKIYTPTVQEDSPFPGELIPMPSSSGDKDTNQLYSTTTAKDKPMPKKRTAVELLSTALNTSSRRVLQSFTLDQSGGFQIGNFESGETGDVRITPNGIVGRDTAGIVAFSLDTNGNLVVKGEIRSGSFITGQVIVGNNRVVIDVDENGEPTIIVNDGTHDRVLIGYGEF
jgi:hypothetical protein